MCNLAVIHFENLKSIFICFKKTEYYNYFDLGKELPIQLSSHRMVSSLDLKRAYIIGGFGGKAIGDARSEILELECSGPNPETCEFKQVKAKLQNARYGHVAVPITDTFVNKNCE